MYHEMDEIENISHKSDGEKQTMAQISFKIIGPASPSRLIVPSLLKVHHPHLVAGLGTLDDLPHVAPQRSRDEVNCGVGFEIDGNEVQDLRKIIAGNASLPIENMRLILRGNVLHDNKNGVVESIKLNNGDSLIVAVKPKPPVKYDRDGLDEDDDEEDLKFQVSQLKRGWQRTLFSFLRDKIRIPYMLLVAIFSVTLKGWAYSRLTKHMITGAYMVYVGFIMEILVTGFAIIFLNLGKREQGDVSAYSIFNEDFRELPGTLNADRLDRDIRAGQF